ncbi:MAG: transcriptional repressor LexA [Candidatus Acidiferrales bacterium]
MALTRKQKRVLDFLIGFLNRHRYSPSFEEIAAGLRLNSIATVHKHLQTLEKKGFIRKGYNQSRSIEIVQLPRPVKEEVARHVFELPLLGRIAAGQPVEAVENPETISLGDFTRSKNVYVLEVKGDSMVEDHILEGDYILVEQTENANNRDIVVALVGEQETTLKRFFREPGGKVRLQPANATMPPIVLPSKDVQIQGRVIGVLRRY